MHVNFLKGTSPATQCYTQAFRSDNSSQMSARAERVCCVWGTITPAKLINYLKAFYIVFDNVTDNITHACLHACTHTHTLTHTFTCQYTVNTACMHTCTQRNKQTHTDTHTKELCFPSHKCIVEHSFNVQGEKLESIHNRAMHNKEWRKVSIWVPSIWIPSQSPTHHNHYITTL